MNLPLPLYPLEVEKNSDIESVGLWWGFWWGFLWEALGHNELTLGVFQQTLVTAQGLIKLESQYN